MKYLNTHFFNAICILSLLGISTQASSVDLVIDQKGQKFNPTTVHINKGDSIKFTNSDPMHHNIYSLSDTDVFDLGAYSQGRSISYTFNKVGSVYIECAIHPFMKTNVIVK